MADTPHADVPKSAASLDVVYTWVDDGFAGYAETLAQYAQTTQDRNPNRTRDNLEMLRFSMRSLDRFAPFVRKVHLLTCRPQVPDWLDTTHPDLVIHHHDDVMDPDILPTFNSFAIVSHLSKLQGVTPRFLYCEDDMLFLNHARASDFIAPDGRIKVFGKPRLAPVHAELDAATETPWNLALATANAALDRDFASHRRRFLAHGPRLIDRAAFEEMCRRFPREIDATRHARFRAGDNVPPEYLFPQFLLETGSAILAPASESRRMAGYASLENFLPWTWYQLVRLDRQRPVSATLNDSFNKTPNPRVVGHIRKVLRSWFPEPSRFERVDATVPI